MKQEYYDLLGVTEDATDEEIDERYRELKKKYNEDRWLDGEAGNEAAKMLNKLDTAYQEIRTERREKARNTSGKSAFEEIEDLIKAGKLTEAQSKLDAFNERNGQWHYWQAALFHKKQWNNECKKQLEIAMQMEPDNAKYKDVYRKFVEQAENKGNAQQAQQEQQQSQRAGNGQYSYSAQDEDQMGGSACSDCLSWCATCFCFNACFNLCCGCH